MSGVRQVPPIRQDARVEHRLCRIKAQAPFLDYGSLPALIRRTNTFRSSTSLALVAIINKCLVIKLVM